MNAAMGFCLHFRVVTHSLAWHGSIAWHLLTLTPQTTQ